MFKAEDTNPGKLNFVWWHPVAGLIFKGSGAKWYVWPRQRCKDKEEKGENIKFINIRYRSNAVVHGNNCQRKIKINSLGIHI